MRDGAMRADGVQDVSPADVDHPWPAEVSPALSAAERAELAELTAAAADVAARLREFCARVEAGDRR